MEPGGWIEPLAGIAMMTSSTTHSPTDQRYPFLAARRQMMATGMIMLQAFEQRSDRGPHLAQLPVMQLHLVSERGVPSRTTENHNCDLQHRRSWLQEISVDNLVLSGSRTWSAGHEDDRIWSPCRFLVGSPALPTLSTPRPSGSGRNESPTKLFWLGCAGNLPPRPNVRGPDSCLIWPLGCRPSVRTSLEN